jgi:hypothetical protein
MFVHLPLMTVFAVTFHMRSSSVFIERSDGRYLETFTRCVTLYEGLAYSP